METPAVEHSPCAAEEHSSLELAECSSVNGRAGHRDSTDSKPGCGQRVEGAACFGEGLAGGVLTPRGTSAAFETEAKSPASTLKSGSAKSVAFTEACDSMLQEREKNKLRRRLNIIPHIN